MTTEPHPDWEPLHRQLLKALEEAPYEQLALLNTTDAAYAFLEAEGERLTEAQYLEARLLLSQAEALLTRYFGM
jgi:hypothetical protein